MVELDGVWTEIRFHDYDRLYAVEGLYERLFYDVLQCRSPETVCSLLGVEMQRADADPAALRVLDLGAGNGIVGEELAKLGVEYMVGVDIIPEAEHAARRDRPDIYTDYLVADMTDLNAEQVTQLAGHRFNGMTCVAALGFGDIPPAAFRTAFNLVENNGWMAFTIKADFLTDEDTSGFADFIRHAVHRDALKLLRSERYEHRLATSGKTLQYTGMIGWKVADMTDDALIS